MDGGAQVIFETDGPALPTAGPEPVSRLSDAIGAARCSFDSSLESIKQAANAVVATLRDAAPNTPDEVELTFGIKALAEIQGFAIAKASGEANFTVKLKWVTPRT